MNRVRIGLVSLLLSVLLVLVTAGNALAFDSKTMNRGSGVGAFATWQQEQSDDYFQLGLQVTQNDEGTFVNVTLITVSGDNKTVFYGGRPVAADIFTIDRELTAASLSEVSVPLFVAKPPIPGPVPVPLSPEPDKTITIAATWTGTGALVKSTYRTQTSDGDFSSKSSSTVISRMAQATGVLDGDELGHTNGQLNNFKYANTFMDK